MDGPLKHLHLFDLHPPLPAQLHFTNPCPPHSDCLWTAIRRATFSSVETSVICRSLWMHNPNWFSEILPTQNSCMNGDTIHIVVVTINNYSHEISGIGVILCDIVSWISRRMLYAATLHHALCLLNQSREHVFSYIGVDPYGLVLMA